MKRTHFYLLLIVFGISVLIRWPLLSDKAQSWQTGNLFMLTTLEIWEQEGAATYNYSPAQTWPNSGDKHMHLYKRLEDEKGDNYYVSHPPLTFLLGHFWFCISGNPVSQVPLQIIGFLLHFLGAITIFKLIFRLTGDNLASILSFCVFTLYPVVLFGYTFHFFSEIIGISLWLLTAWFVYRIWEKNNGSSKHLVILGLLNLLFVYTDWMGVFFTLSVSFYMFFQKGAYSRKLAYTLIGSTLAGLVVIVVQYSSIAGFNEMMHSMGLRFMERSGFFGAKYSDQQLSFFSLNSYKELAEQFHHHMKWLGYVFVLLLSLVLLMKKKLRVPSWMWWSLLGPSLLHLILFFNTNVLHYVYQAKWAVIVAFFLPLVLMQMPGRFKLTSTLLVMLAIVASVMHFKNDIPVERTDGSLEVTAQKLQLISKEEAIFIKSEQPLNLLYLGYLSKRNVIGVEKLEEIKPDKYQIVEVDMVGGIP